MKLTHQVFWTAFQALPEEVRVLFIEKIINEEPVYEDVVDSMIAEERKDEPSISLEEYITERP